MFNIDWEPFNGMAHRPWLMFIGLILTIIAWTAMLFMCIFSGNMITLESETTLIQTNFIAYSTSRNDLHLSSSTGKTYSIHSYAHYNGYFDDPSLLCDGEIYNIWVTKAGHICAMTNSSGEQLVSFEAEREAYRNSQRDAIVIMATMLILNIAYFSLALIVSKNPLRYPSWLVKLLFANASDFLS